MAVFRLIRRPCLQPPWGREPRCLGKESWFICVRPVLNELYLWFGSLTHSVHTGWVMPGRVSSMLNYHLPASVWRRSSASIGRMPLYSPPFTTPTRPNHRSRRRSGAHWEGGPGDYNRRDLLPPDRSVNLLRPLRFGDFFLRWWFGFVAQTVNGWHVDGDVGAYVVVSDHDGCNGGDSPLRAMVNLTGCRVLVRVRDRHCVARGCVPRRERLQRRPPVPRHHRPHFALR